MKFIKIFCLPTLGSLIGCLSVTVAGGIRPQPGWAQVTTPAPIHRGDSYLVDLQEAERRDRSVEIYAVTLTTGFTPDPTVLEGRGGGDQPAKDVVNIQHTGTGACLGFITLTPHEEITLKDNFSNLEMLVESEIDTTLIVSGPGGVWCNDDSQGQNPAISGEWLPGLYQVWIGAYSRREAPSYRLYISDQS
ncbi:MAG: hypothetical protein AAFQ89_17825 [Cyanobacteria bacterium J06626_18]